MIERKRRALSPASPVFWGVIVTVGLALLDFLLAIGNGPTGEPRFLEFLTLPANAIGDTLAGIFAPLVFIWIVVTVFIQSQSLSEQRRELVLTRQEMSLARKAEQDQLSVMRVQARILEDEKSSRDQDVARQYIAKWIRLISSTIRTSRTLSISWRPILQNNEGIPGFEAHWSLVSPEPPPADAEEALEFYAEQIVRSSGALTDLVRTGPTRLEDLQDMQIDRRPVFLEDVAKLMTLCQETMDLRAGSSAEELKLLNHLQIDQLLSALENVRDIFETAPP